MKKFLWAYLSSLGLLLAVLFYHYVEIMQMALGEASSEIVWKFEVIWMLFLQPFFGLTILQSILFFGVYLILLKIFKGRNLNSSILLFGLMLIAITAAALFLSLFEPILSFDYFEYGTRQELNKVFERLGYLRINVTVYIYLTLTAILTWIFVKKESNKTPSKPSSLADSPNLLDH